MAEAAYTAKDITVLEGLEPVRLRPGCTSGRRAARPAPPRLRGGRQRGRRGSCGPQRPGRRDDSPRQLGHRPRRGRRYPGRRHSGAGDACAHGRPRRNFMPEASSAARGTRSREGFHGVGVSVVNALSEWLVAEVRRDGKVYRQEFARGGPTTDMTTVGVAGKDESGTTDCLPAGLRGVRGDGVRRRDSRPAPPRDGLSDPRAPDRRPRRTRRRADRRVPLRRRDQGLRRARQRGEGSGAQAHRLLRG